MNVTVRVRPHQTLAREDIIIRDRIRGVVADTLPELVESIAELGLLYPLLIDDTCTLVDGRQRLEALTLLGVTDIPVLIVSDITEAATPEQVLAERLHRELATNGVRTAFTPVQAAAARRRLRELHGRTRNDRTGTDLATRRKNWASELATAETGVSRTTMDRVDKIVRIAENDTAPLPVRREAAEALTRIDQGGAVDRVLKEVELAAKSSAALNRYPDLAALPSPAAQVSMAAHLDTLPDPARTTQLDALRALWVQPPAIVDAYQRLRDTTRIEALFTAGQDAADALTTLCHADALPTEVRERWQTVTDRLEHLTATLHTALTPEDPRD